MNTGCAASYFWSGSIYSPIRRPLSATPVDLDKLPVDIPAILPLSNPVPQLVGNNPVRLVSQTKLCTYHQ